ncbi:hypothetical protein Avbf_05102, partial [Armadillidium vulgare]
ETNYIQKGETKKSSVRATSVTIDTLTLHHNQESFSLIREIVGEPNKIS